MSCTMGSWGFSSNLVEIARAEAWKVVGANENEHSDSWSRAGTAEAEDPPATCRHDPIVETAGECHRSYSYIYKLTTLRNV